MTLTAAPASKRSSPCTELKEPDFDSLRGREDFSKLAAKLEERTKAKAANEIFDRGRGLQLSTSRVTVQDLVPYFQRGESYEEIMRWIPILTREEIAVVDRYYREHQRELDEHDRCIRARTEERARQQRPRFPEPEGTPEERLTRLKQRHQERNGARTSG